MENNSDYVFHYTSASALIGILTSRKIWATNIAYMNDSREGEVSSSILRGYVDAQFRRGLAGAEVKDMFLYLLNRRKHCFFTSFCAKKDSLDLFRLYGSINGGYCIGFPRNYIESIPGSVFIDCVYSPEDQKNHVINLYDKYIDDIKDACKKHLAKLDVVKLLGNDFLEDLSELSEKHKSNEFSVENESRLISRDWGSRKFRVSSAGNVIVPYTEIDLPNSDIEVYISSGPNTAGELAARGFQDLVSSVSLSGSNWTFRMRPGLDSGYRVY